MNYVYTNASKSLWQKATEAEKAEAKRIYKVLKASKNKREKFRLEHPKIVFNAIEVLFFPYDDNDGRAWYWVDGKAVEVSVKQFNILRLRNDTVKHELKRLKAHLGLGKRPIEDRIKAIHSYICEDVEYDYSDKGYYSLYDTLFGKKVVCMGYAILMKALCDISNVVCQCVNNDTHMWNRVMLDGKTYYIDATWNDANNYEKYFMIPETEFYKIHPHHTQVDWYGWIV